VYLLVAGLGELPDPMREHAEFISVSVHSGGDRIVAVGAGRKLCVASDARERPDD
jgi:hypothetical protein